MLDSAHANWIVLQKVNGGGNLPYRGTQTHLPIPLVCKSRENHAKTYLVFFAAKTQTLV